MLKGMLKKISGDSAASSPEVAPVVVGHLEPEDFRKFQAFSQLADDDLTVLSGQLELMSLDSGQRLFRPGDEESLDYLLNSGTIELVGSDGSRQEVEAGSERARLVVSSLRPRRHTATALTPCTYVGVEAETLYRMLAPQVETLVHGEAQSSEYLVEELSEEALAAMDKQELLDSFHHDLKAGSFKLTTLPEVALKIRKVIDESDAPSDAIANVISSDPVIATKIIKASNSVFFKGRDPCETVTDAVVRLGVKTTRQLVMSFTMRDLFQSDKPELRRAMKEAWDHTVYVGAIGAALARTVKQFSPEEGMLAAIMSNVGVLSVFNYLGNHPELYADPVRLQLTVEELKSEVGAEVLENWDFPTDYVQCARDGGNWSRASEGDPDLCDLVIASTLHAHIGRRKVPRIDAVPACQRLLGDDASPEFALSFMQSAREEIGAASSLVNA